MPTVLGLTNDPPKTQVSSQVHTQSSASMSGNGKGPRKSTISARNHAAALEVETLLWRALCDSPDAAREYIADDCVMLNPLFSDSDDPVDSESNPSLDKLLKGAKPWSSFRMHQGVKVVEIDLMAVALLYRVTLFRNPTSKGPNKGEAETVEATVSSSWRQIAGGDWKLVAQHVAPMDDYGYDDDE